MYVQYFCYDIFQYFSNVHSVSTIFPVQPISRQNFQAAMHPKVKLNVKLISLIAVKLIYAHVCVIVISL